MTTRHIVTNGPDAEIDALLNIGYDKAFVVADTNTVAIAKSVCGHLPRLREAQTIVIPAGEQNKNMETLTYVLKALAEGGASRRSLVVNVGGGVVSDLGGFAAAIFKRGVRHVNFSTTLLGAVDAAIGGKTAIDFLGLKNEVGAFSMPEMTWTDVSWFSTLPRREMLSGYAEMVKMAYIDPNVPLPEISSLVDKLSDPSATRELAEAVRLCAGSKQRIVDADPTEQGLRSILNFGHTAGHAFESWALQRGDSLTHGEAVAHGIAVALILSHDILGMPSRNIYAYFDKILKPLYPALKIKCDDYDSLLHLMRHDKKSVGGEVKFVLLKEIGEPQPGVSVGDADICTALDIYRDLSGI